MYVIQFIVRNGNNRNKAIVAENMIQMPIIIMTPNNSVMQANKGKRKNHVFW